MNKTGFSCIRLLTVFTFLLYFLSGTVTLFSETVTPEISLRSFSGSPLLIDIAVNDPDYLLKSITVQTFESCFIYSVNYEALSRNDSDNYFNFKLTPFQKPGVYDLTLIIETLNGKYSRSFQTGFADYLWGRDNFRFANIGETEESKDYYSSLLFSWAENRFGKLEEKEKIVILYYLYLMFGDRTGNCYAFSGSQVRYRLYPDLLPSYYPTVYSIRGAYQPIRKEMNFYQNDIAFYNFIHKGIDYDAEQSLTDLIIELDKIISNIRDGVPAVTGYLAENSHHSMVVYGFIKDLDKNTINLIAANNWEDEADTNTHCKDAENILVSLDYENRKKSILWIDNYGRTEERLEKIIALDIKKEFKHDPETFKSFVNKNLDKLFIEQAGIIIVEQADNVYIQNNDSEKTGLINLRTVRQMENIDFRSIESNYLFRFPSGENFSFYFSKKDCGENKDQELSIFYLSAGKDKSDGFYESFCTNIELQCGETAEAIIKAGRFIMSGD